MGVSRALQGLQGTIGQPTAQVVGGSLRFKGGQYLERTSTAGNQTTWTWSCWIKTSDLSGNNIFGEDGGYPNAAAFYQTDGKIRFSAAAADSSVFLNVITSAQFRDFSAWYNVVIVYDSGNTSSSERARIYVNGKRIKELSTATYPSQDATTVVNSNGNAFRIGSHSGVDHLQGYMSQCYFIDGLVLGPGYFGSTDPLTGTWRPKKLRQGDPTVNNGTTWSSKVTATGSGAVSGINGSYPVTGAFDTNSGTYLSTSHANISSSPAILTVTFPPGNQPSFFSDVVVTVGGSSTDTLKISFNGSEFKTVKNPTAAFIPHTFATGTGKIQEIKVSRQKSNTNVGGAEIQSIFVDGVQLLDATTTTVDFGTNGFYLPMDNQDDFEKDRSGKGHIFTKSGFSGTSSDPDVVKDSHSGAVFGNPPTSGITTTSSASSNYATLNPININDMGGTTSVTFSDAGLTVANARNTYFGTALSTLSMTTGKYYCEGTVDSNDASTLLCGILKIDPLESRWNTDDEQIGYFQYGYGYRSNNGNKENNSSNSSYGNSYGDGDTIGIALDLDAKTISFYKNGTNQGVAYSGIPAGQYAFGFSCSETNNKWKANFGQKPFKYTPPQGYLPLNSATARPNKVVPRPDHYVGVTTYSGNGTDGRSVSDFNFGTNPDFVWIKPRVSGGHVIQDTVRGAGNKVLSSAHNSAQGGETYGQIQSFDRNGFSVESGTTSDENINYSNRNYVAWCWRAGGNKNTFNVDGEGFASAAAAGLSGGDISPTAASVGTKQGFSIITWDTASLSGTKSIATGLTQAPEFVITKVTTTTDDWLTFHKDLSSTESLILNGTRAKLANAAYAHTFNSDGTISGLVVGDPNWWMSNETYIFYSWHSVPGLQKFGSYEGNANADGPFIELGFRAAVIIAKNADNADDWVIVDTTRSSYNPQDETLFPNSTNGEDTGSFYIDILSNGFKLRHSSGKWNSSGHTFIYAAWAEAPTSNLFGGQSNAR